MCLASQIWAALHPKIKPSKPKLCLKMASWTPKKGQGGPKIAQDGPKMGPKRADTQRVNRAR